MITHLNASEKQMEEYLFNVQAKTHAKVLNHVPVFFDSLKLMQLAVESGNADEISTYKCVADYLIANNDNFELVDNDAINKLVDSFCLAVRAEDKELKTALDKVIDEMKSDGTLDKLVGEYIIGVNKGQAPAKIEIPTIDGAATLKVGVTGDLPPLDLILPDNSPAGFNTALLAEIAKRLNRNIELVQIESGARAAALNSNLIDVVFWAIVPLGKEIPSDIDKPEGLELSAPYFQDNVAHLKLK